MNHWILFTGHMIDAENRAKPRFPAEKEQMARHAIREYLVKEKEKSVLPLKGIAGGACGGDILFNELCLELNIPSEIFLALPKEEFKKASVSFAGKDWEDRYERLVSQLPVFILSTEKEKDDNVWELANEWMLKTAMTDRGENMTLIALWDGKKGDGGGGTEHMVEITKKNGGNAIIIDTNTL